MSKDSIYLIDGTSLCYRSFYAINLATASGFPTGAIYGVHRILTKIFSKYSPKYVGMCFDVSRKTFRTEKFKEYKINRRPMPDDLGLQLPHIRKLIEAMGITIIQKQGYEADDVIASLCKKALANNFSVVIVSSDKDFYQLLTCDDVEIFNQSKDVFINKDRFFKDFGFKPQQIIDYLSLAGDASDNVP